MDGVYYVCMCHIVCGLQKAFQDELLTPLFFIALLALGGHIYRQDLRVILIKPLSSIVTMVQNLAQNPLGDLTVKFPEG